MNYQTKTKDLDALHELISGRESPVIGIPEGEAVDPENWIDITEKAKIVDKIEKMLVLNNKRAKFQ